MFFTSPKETLFTLEVSLTTHKVSASEEPEEGVLFEEPLVAEELGERTIASDRTSSMDRALPSQGFV